MFLLTLSSVGACTVTNLPVGRTVDGTAAATAAPSMLQTNDDGKVEDSIQDVLPLLAVPHLSTSGRDQCNVGVFGGDMTGGVVTGDCDGGSGWCNGGDNVELQIGGSVRNQPVVDTPNDVQGGEADTASLAAQKSCLDGDKVVLSLETARHPPDVDTRIPTTCDAKHALTTSWWKRLPTEPQPRTTPPALKRGATVLGTPNPSRNLCCSGNSNVVGSKILCRSHSCPSSSDLRKQISNDGTNQQDVFRSTDAISVDHKDDDNSEKETLFFTAGASSKGKTNWGAGVCGRGETLSYTGDCGTTVCDGALAIREQAATAAAAASTGNISVHREKAIEKAIGQGGHPTCSPRNRARQRTRGVGERLLTGEDAQDYGQVMPEGNTGEPPTLDRRPDESECTQSPKNTSAAPCGGVMDEVDKVEKEEGGEGEELLSSDDDVDQDDDNCSVATELDHDGSRRPSTEEEEEFPQPTPGDGCIAPGSSSGRPEQNEIGISPGSAERPTEAALRLRPESSSLRNACIGDENVVFLPAPTETNAQPVAVAGAGAAVSGEGPAIRSCSPLEESHEVETSSATASPMEPLRLICAGTSEGGEGEEGGRHASGGVVVTRVDTTACTTEAMTAATPSVSWRPVAVAAGEWVSSRRSSLPLTSNVPVRADDDACRTEPPPTLSQGVITVPVAMEKVKQQSRESDTDLPRPSRSTTSASPAHTAGVDDTAQAFGPGARASDSAVVWTDPLFGKCSERGGNSKKRKQEGGHDEPDVDLRRMAQVLRRGGGGGGGRGGEGSSNGNGLPGESSHRRT